jgi:serine/threonine-protein kinase
MKFRVTLPLPKLNFAWRSVLIVAAWIVGGGALVGGAFGLSFYLSIQSAAQSSEIEVPDLTGLDLDAASERVKPMELRLQIVDQRNDPATPSGRVLEQMPRAGSSVRRGRKVKLVVSLGGEVLAVPDLIGQASPAVEIELRQQGFVPGDLARVKVARVRTGAVISQVPPPDTPAVPSTRVHRLVSDGPPDTRWVMPDLTGVRRSDVESWVARSGFRRGAVRRVRMGGWPPGTVVGQLPLPGYPVRKRDVVELTVAR